MSLNFVAVWVSCVIGLITIYLLVSALISNYFREKENFVDRLQRKAKEDQHG